MTSQFCSLRFHWLIPKIIAATNAKGPTTPPTIADTSEERWRGSVDGVDAGVDGGRVCVVELPASVSLDEETDEAVGEILIEEVLDDEVVLAAAVLKVKLAKIN